MTYFRCLRPQLRLLQGHKTRLIWILLMIVVLLYVKKLLKVRISNNDKREIHKLQKVYIKRQQYLREAASHPDNAAHTIISSNREINYSNYTFNVFKNVCLFPSDNRRLQKRNTSYVVRPKFTLELRAYDVNLHDDVTQDVASGGKQANDVTSLFSSTSKRTSLACKGATTCGDVTNKVTSGQVDTFRLIKHSKYRLTHHDVMQIPKHVTFSDEAAYFPSEWRNAVNLYIYLDRVVPASYVTADYCRRHRLGNSTVVVATDTSRTIPSFLQMHLDVGMSHIYELGNFVKGAQPKCFKYGLFQKPVDHDNAVKTAVVRTLSKKWRLNAHVCTDKYVLILDRGSDRRIVNIGSIVSYLQKMNISSIRVEKFEGKTAKEQAEIMHCANVFIAVQGAGMNWYKFLPPNARMLEITWHAWVSRYLVRAADTRPDVHARIVQCQMFTPPEVYLKYARMWLNFTGSADNVTDAMKKQLLDRSLPLDSRKVSDNIQRESDAYCDPKLIHKHMTDPHQQVTL